MLVSAMTSRKGLLSTKSTSLEPKPIGLGDERTGVLRRSDISGILKVNRVQLCGYSSADYVIYVNLLLCDTKCEIFNGIILGKVGTGVGLSRWRALVEIKGHSTRMIVFK